MLELLMGDETCDCVAAVQELRHENPLLRGCKELFYRLFNRMSDTRIEADVSDFRVFTRQVADALLSMGETFRFSKGLFGWIGFRTRVVPYQVRDRCSGSSKWSFKSLMSYAWNGILAFSTWPLKVIMALGVVLALFSLVLLGVDVFDKLVLNDELSLTMVLIYVVLLLGGLQIRARGARGVCGARLRRGEAASDLPDPGCGGRSHRGSCRPRCQRVRCGRGEPEVGGLGAAGVSCWSAGSAHLRKMSFPKRLSGALRSAK